MEVRQRLSRPKTKRAKANVIKLEREVHSVKANWHYRYEEGEDYDIYSIGMRGVIFMTEHNQGTPLHRVDVYYDCGKVVSLHNINEVEYRRPDDERT